MADGIAIVTTGDRKLNRDLRKLEPNAQKKIVRRASRAGMKFVLRDALTRVPENEGTLASSLRVRAMKRKRGAIGTVVETREGLFEGEAFYGGFLELGTQERFHASGKSTGSVDEEQWAYLRPALYGNETTVRRMFIDVAKSELATLLK